MAEAIKKVAILGGGGTLGPHIINGLLDSKFEVSVISRPASVTTFPTSVSVHRSDFTKGSLVSVLRGQHAVIDIRSRTDVETWKMFADAALEAGVRRYIPSGFVLDIENELCANLHGENKARVHVRQHVKQLATENCSFTYTNVTNGTFLDWGIRTGFIGIDLSSRSAVIYNGGKTKFCATLLHDIGRAVAAILRHPAETENQDVYISSITTTQNEIIEVLEEKTAKTWTRSGEIDTEQLAKRSREKIETGDNSFQNVFAMAMSGIFDEKYGPDYGERAVRWNELLGLGRRDLSDLLSSVL